MSSTRHLNPKNWEYRSFHYHPPDPVGQAASTVEACRKRLREFDADLTVWWSASSECWRVMQWYHSVGNWIEQLKWCGPNGEYRNLESPDSIIRAMQKIRVDPEVVDQECEEHNDALEKKRWQDSVELSVIRANEARLRRQGVQAVFSAHPTSAAQARPRLRSDVLAPTLDPEYVKLRLARGVRRYGRKEA